MNDQRVLLDPTAELNTTLREGALRPESLQGLRIGLLDISKPRGDLFMSYLAARIRERGMQALEFVKPTFTRVAPAALLAQMSGEIDVVIEGLAD